TPSTTTSSDGARAASDVHVRRGQLSMRGRVSDEATARASADLCAAVVASALGLRVRAAVRAVSAAEGGGFVFDLLASRERPRGAHVPDAIHLVAFADAVALDHNALAVLTRLAPGGVLALPSESESAA